MSSAHPIIIRPCFILRRHGRRHSCRTLSVSRRHPTKALCRPARRRQCAPIYLSNLSANVKRSYLLPTVNSAMQTVPDSCSLAPDALPLPGRSERALSKSKANTVAVLPPRYSAELDPFGGCAVKTIKSPVVLTLERQQREKQRSQRESAAQGSEQANGAEVKEIKPPLLHDSDSDVPPTKMLAQASPKKKSSRFKAKAEPPRTTSHTGVDSGGAGKKVRVLQEKKAPRKRKEHTKAPLDKDSGSNDDEHTHGPPNKKRRRADPTTARCAFLFSFPVLFGWAQLRNIAAVGKRTKKRADQRARRLLRLRRTKCVSMFDHVIVDASHIQ
jgi:hypothetical protein